MPVIASEFGWDERNHPPGALRADGSTGGGRYQEAILNAFDQPAMGWQAWCFSHLFTPALLANPQFEPSGDFGAHVRQALQLRKHAG